MNLAAELIQEVVGEKLSAITFVLDYYQFQFDGPMFNVTTPVTVVAPLHRGPVPLLAELFNVTTPVTVVAPEGRASTGDERFCNLIRGRIGKVVRSIEVVLETAIVITFEDSSLVHFSLKPEDYPGQEAVLYFGNNKEWCVF